MLTFICSCVYSFPVTNQIFTCNVEIRSQTNRTYPRFGYSKPVMWSETVGLRARSVSGLKIGRGLSLELAVLMCCETRSCYARRHNDLEGHSNFSSTIYIVSLFCAWNITTWRPTVAFTYLKVKSAKCFVYFRWFWSCYFGLDLGLRLVNSGLGLTLMYAHSCT